MFIVYDFIIVFKLDKYLGEFLDLEKI